MMTGDLRSMIAQASQRLAQVSDSPGLDAQLIAAHVLGKPREWIVAHADDAIPGSKLAQIQSLLHRRARGEPVAYLTGRVHFWKHELQVTPDTLIPRPETELLIELVLERFDTGPRRVADLGTGSGAIAISLAAERPDWQITATDIDPLTLAVAKENADSLSNIHFRACSWLDGLDQVFDLVVSNPPYVRASDPHLDALGFEPELALVAGEDGLTAIREIASNSYHRLTPDGCLLVEHGYDQAPAVCAIMHASGFSNAETFYDVQGHQRATLARK